MRVTGDAKTTTSARYCEHERRWHDGNGHSHVRASIIGRARLTHPASAVNKILEINLKDEKHAVDIYLGIMKKIHEMKDELKYEFFQLEHKIRHIITDEQEHIAELKLLMGTKKELLVLQILRH